MEDLIKRWEADLVGLQRAAKRYGRAEDYVGAHEAFVSAQTMQTVIREAKAALTTQGEME